MALLSSYTDEQLIPLLTQGNDAAYTEIYNRYINSLTNYAAARLSSLDEARDIIHDLFFVLWKQREEIFIHTSLQAYLFTAIRFRIIRHIRKESSREKYKAMLLQRPPSVGSWEATGQVEASNLRQQVESSIDSLSPRTKRIYQLSRHQQLSIPEIATQLDISEQTVKNQLSAALGHLRQAWDKLATFLILIIANW